MTSPAILPLLLSLLFPSLIFSQDFSKKLKQAYKEDDSEALHALLMEWSNALPSNEDARSRENDTLATVYAVYNAFYSPFDLERIGQSEWGDSLYVDKIALIQNSLTYDFSTFSLLEGETRPMLQGDRFGAGEVHDFRPKTRLPEEKRAYLTEAYHSELQQFLGNQHKPFGRGGLMRPARAAKKSQKRQAFLSAYLTIIQGHWGGYWHVATHPELTHMTLSPDLSQALISFRLVYEGGEAYLERQGEEWKLVSSYLTWIE